MRDRKIKLIYFSTQGSEVKTINLTWKRILSIMFSSFVVMLLLVGSSIALFTDAYHDIRVASLSKTNQILSNHLQQLNKKLTRIEAQMQIVEKDDNALRTIARLSPLDEDLRRVGFGGTTEENPELNALPMDIKTQTQQVNLALNELERRIKLHFNNVKEVRERFREDSVQIKHTPSIRPVIDGRITDKFGMRLDPFIDRVKHHDGIDIAAEPGTEVYAAAAGRVEKAEATYRPGEGFGKVVIIDHGNGLKTLYGHLSQVLVKTGQMVNRWDLIGLVGETGRATGPHLHYEVWGDGKPINPESHIMN
ncbi:MAG: M23 family metallopeptidase [candidate division KSB1 bacterium]|nr:M23 family metallopeptidase [candidate division KSB1 bacterium]MDZ7304635.1 M23 family metallopeptidase [candidate division KSB1 bacterium]MDZ7313767.1 M23 family metallopeptidase [candidate division KSB1 bacterium]